MRGLPSITRMFGIELEFILLDESGNVANNADQIIARLKDALPDSDLKKECGHSMVELTSFPQLSSRHVFDGFLNDLASLLYTVNESNHRLFCLGTYPGRSRNEMREDIRYSAKENILGKKNFLNAGRCVGFHYHYSLPRNSFNRKIKFFYPDINGRNKEKVTNIHNLFIALDPVATTFMQSSPYFEGRYLGKDSRMIAYRGDPQFRYPDSVYANRQEFGVLNEYCTDYTDLVDSTRKRFESWRFLLQEAGFSFNRFIKKDSSILDSSWKPVKISPHGTIELRGPDMNYPSKVVALSRMMKSVTGFINKDFISVIPSKLGNQEPFKLEDGTLHVPETGYLHSTLQKMSATKGIADPDVYRYCKRFSRFIGEIISENKQDKLRLLHDMLDEKETSSDKLLADVKKIQGKDSLTLSDETAREIGIRVSDRLFKDTLLTDKMCERIDY